MTPWKTYAWLPAPCAIQLSSLVAVDLRRYDEGDIRIAEVADSSGQEVRLRNVVGVHLGDDVVLTFVGVSPRIVVAGLRLGLEGT